MTLPASGTLTIANIRDELGKTGSVAIPNDAWRALAGKASGSIVIPTNFYGKSRFSLEGGGNDFNFNAASTSIAGVSLGEAGVVNDGLPDAGRRIFVCGVWTGTAVRSLTSASIAGVAASINAEIEFTSSGFSVGTFMINANVPSATTSGTVVLNWSGAVKSVRIKTVRVIDLELTDGTTDSDGGSGALSLSGNATVPSGTGLAALMVVGSSCETGTPGGISMAGATEQEETLSSNIRLAIGFNYAGISAGSRAFSASATNPSNGCMAFCSVVGRNVT